MNTFEQPGTHSFNFTEFTGSGFSQGFTVLPSKTSIRDLSTFISPYHIYMGNGIVLSVYGDGTGSNNMVVDRWLIGGCTGSGCGAPPLAPGVFNAGIPYWDTNNSYASNSPPGTAYVAGWQIGVEPATFGATGDWITTTGQGTIDYVFCQKRTGYSDFSNFHIRWSGSSSSNWNNFNMSDGVQADITLARTAAWLANFNGTDYVYGGYAFDLTWDFIYQWLKVASDNNREVFMWFD